MLSIDVMGSEACRFVRYEMAGFALGFTVLLISLVCLWFPIEKETPILLFQTQVLVGIGMISISGWRLFRKLLQGGIYTRLIANSKTLAIVPRGSRAIFIKKTMVAAVRDGGNTFVMADGTTHRLRDMWSPMSYRFEDAFLSPLYDLWWPTCPLHRVRRVLGERAPTFARFFFILWCGWTALAPLAFLDSTAFSWLLPVTVCALVVVLFLLLVAVLRMFAETKGNLFHFEGPEAQENWDLIATNLYPLQEAPDRTLEESEHAEG